MKLNICLIFTIYTTIVYINKYDIIFILWILIYIFNSDVKKNLKTGPIEKLDRSEAFIMYY